jgi:hypothetical protein
MIRRHDLDIPQPVQPPAQTGNLLFCLQQRLRGEIPQGTNHAGLWTRQLGLQNRPTGAELIREGMTIIGRPTFNHIEDVNVLSSQANRLNDAREQLSGLADKRLALLILIATWRLPDKYQLGLWIPGAKDHLGATLMQSTLLTMPTRLGELL